MNLDEIKFVITDKKDYIWAKEILIREKKTINKGSRFIFPLPNLKIV